MIELLIFAAGFAVGGLVVGRWVYLQAVEGAQEWLRENWPVTRADR